MTLSPNKKPFRFDLGDRGEVIAWNYLTKQGYEILVKNYRCKIGEIDIIAKKDKRIVFIEVKTRQTDRFGRPEEAVGMVKQKKLVKLALWYLKEKKMENHPVSFAVIAVSWKEKEDPSVQLIPNAFEVPEDFL